MQPIRAAFFDIDGTLLQFESHRAAPSTLRALEQMRAAGMLLFIASGRAPLMLDALRDALAFRFDGYVLTNGQCCTDADLVPFYNQALPAAYHPPFAGLAGTPIPRWCAPSLRRPAFTKTAARPQVDAVCAAHRLKPPRHPIQDPVRALTHPTYQLNAYMPPEMDAPFAAAVPGVKAVRWNPVFADIIPADGGKAEGMARMLARFGLRMDQCIAFGDGGNDMGDAPGPPASAWPWAMRLPPSRPPPTMSPPRWKKAASGRPPSISG